MDDESDAVPSHPLVLKLWQAVELRKAAGQPTSQELLEAFWADVASQRTPLLHDANGVTGATFLYREDIDHMIDRDRAFRRIVASFDSFYLDLRRIPHAVGSLGTGPLHA